MTIYVTTVRPRLSGKLSRGEIKREPRSSVVTGSWIEPDEPFLARMQPRAWRQMREGLFRS
jgi:hypothetical protein